MDDLIQSMESALAEFSSGRTQQPLRTVLEGRPRPRVLRRDAGLHAGERRARHQAGDGLRQQPRARTALAPGDDPPARLDDRRAAWRSWTDATSPRRERLRCRRSAARLLARPTPASWRCSGRACRRAATCGRSAHVRALRECGSGARPLPIGAFADDASRDCRAHFARSASARDAVDGADLVVAGHRGAAPVLRSEWIRRRRAHLRRRRVPAGSARDGHRARRARRGCSSIRGRRRSPKRATSLLPIAEGAFDAEAHRRRAGRAGGRARAGPQSPGEITIFKSLGMAVEDVAAAHLAIRAGDRARARPRQSLVSDPDETWRSIAGSCSSFASASASSSSRRCACGLPPTLRRRRRFAAGRLADELAATAAAHRDSPPRRSARAASRPARSAPPAAPASRQSRAPARRAPIRSTPPT